MREEETIRQNVLCVLIKCIAVCNAVQEKLYRVYRVAHIGLLFLLLPLIIAAAMAVKAVIVVMKENNVVMGNAVLLIDVVVGTNVLEAVV